MSLRRQRSLRLTALQNSTTLRKLEGVTVNKVVLHVQSVALDGILCFIYSDGSFEYRERATLAETFPEPGFDRITHISQAGFSYTDDEPCTIENGSL
jgi:mediator of RNA polymerase II transcription subunit 16, fungi type